MPRLLPECGHTYCTGCLDKLISESEQQDTFNCPECPENEMSCAKKPSANQFPKNFALLRLAEKTLKKTKAEQVPHQQQSKQQLPSAKSQDNQQEEDLDDSLKCP